MLHTFSRTLAADTAAERESTKYANIGTQFLLQ